MILCPNHHREAIEGAMLKAEQLQYKNKPYNISKNFVEGCLKINQSAPIVTIGFSEIVGEGDFIIVDGESLLSLFINNGRLELSLKLYDQNDNLVAEVERNEWISGDPLPWDLESKYQWIRLRKKLRDIDLEIDARKFPIRIRADMWKNGQNILLNPKGIYFNGVAGKHIGIIGGCYVGGYFGVDTKEKRTFIDLNPRFPKMHLISEPDINKRIKKGLRAWKKLLNDELRQIQQNCNHVFEIEDRGVERYLHLVCKKCGLVRVKNRD